MHLLPFSYRLQIDPFGLRHIFSLMNSLSVSDSFYQPHSNLFFNSDSCFISDASDSSNFWYKYYRVNMPSKGGLTYHLTCLLYIPYLVVKLYDSKIMNLAPNCRYSLTCERPSMLQAIGLYVCLPTRQRSISSCHGHD